MPVTQQDILDHLQKTAPDIAALLAKDVTAGDVHATTALGNEKPKPKAKPFKDLIADLRNPAAHNEDDDAVDVVEAPKSWSIPLDIVKALADKQQIFGWASVVEKNGVLVIDKQDDVILPDDLEKAAYDFVLDGREQGDMHVRKGVGRLIESMIFTKQKQEVLGIDLGMVGWWVGFKVDDDGLWKAIKDGQRPEFSIGGSGKRVDVA